MLKPYENFALAIDLVNKYYESEFKYREALASFGLSLSASNRKVKKTYERSMKNLGDRDSIRDDYNFIIDFRKKYKHSKKTLSKRAEFFEKIFMVFYKIDGTLFENNEELTIEQEYFYYVLIYIIYTCNVAAIFCRGLLMERLYKLCLSQINKSCIDVLKDIGVADLAQIDKTENISCYLKSFLMKDYVIKLPSKWLENSKREDEILANKISNLLLQEYYAALKELGLSPDASLNDITIACRQRKEILNPMSHRLVDIDIYCNILCNRYRYFQARTKRKKPIILMMDCFITKDTGIIEKELLRKLANEVNQLSEEYKRSIENAPLQASENRIYNEFKNKISNLLVDFFNKEYKMEISSDAMSRYFTLFENKGFSGLIDFVNRILYIRKLEQSVLNPDNKDEPVELVEFINELIKQEKTRIIDLESSLTETEYINMFDTLTKKIENIRNVYREILGKLLKLSTLVYSINDDQCSSEFDDLKGNVLSILEGVFMSPEALEQNQQLIPFLEKIEALHKRCSSIAQSSIRTQLEQSSGKIYVKKHESSTSKTDFAMFYYVEDQQEQIEITEINPVNKTVTSYYANDDDLALNYISLSELVNGAVFLNEVVTYDGHLEHIVCSCEGYAITINLEYGYRINVGQFGKSQITDTVCSEKNVVSRENENVSGKLVGAIRAQLLTQVKKFKKAPSSVVKCHHKPVG